MNRGAGRALGGPADLLSALRAVCSAAPTLLGARRCWCPRRARASMPPSRSSEWPCRRRRRGRRRAGICGQPSALPMRTPHMRRTQEGPRQRRPRRKQLRPCCCRHHQAQRRATGTAGGTPLLRDRWTADCSRRQQRLRPLRRPPRPRSQPAQRDRWPRPASSAARGGRVTATGKARRRPPFRTSRRARAPPGLLQPRRRQTAEQDRTGGATRGQRRRRPRLRRTLPCCRARP